MVVGGGKYQYLYFFGHKIVIFFLVMKKKILCKDYIGRQKSTIIHESKQEARLIFYLTYLYEQMILVPPHILIVRCIALWVKSTSHRAMREEWRFYVHMYNILHTSKQLNVQQPTRGWGVLSDTKFSSHPQKKGQVQRSASFWNCVIYA